LDYPEIYNVCSKYFHKQKEWEKKQFLETKNLFRVFPQIKKEKKQKQFLEISTPKKVVLFGLPRDL